MCRNFPTRITLFVPFAIISILFFANPELQGQQIPEETASQIEQLKQAVLSSEESSGTSHPNTISARDKWATAIAESGDLATAFPIAQENFDLVVANLDPKQGHELPMEVNLLLSQLFYAKAQPELAFEARRRLIKWGEEKAGAEHLSTLAFKTALAKTFADARKFEDAIRINESVIGKLESKLPADHSLVVINQKLLLDWYYASKQYEEAIKYGSRCLTTLLKGKAVDAITLEVAQKLADSYVANKQPEQAVPWMEKTLARCAEVNIAPNNPRLLQFKTTLASVYFDAGDLASAIEQLEEVVPAYGKLVGESHDATISTRSMLTMYYKLNGQFEQAIANSQPLLDLSIKKYGAKHPIVLGLQDGLAALHEKAGNQDASDQIKKKVTGVRQQLEGQLASAKKQFDEDQVSAPGILPESTSEVIVAYSNLGKDKEAIELATNYQTQCIEKHGLGSLKTFAANSSLANALFSCGRDRDALTRRVEFVQQLEKQLGTDKPPTLLAKIALARNLWMLGKQRQSIELWEDTLKKMAVDPGPEDHFFIMGKVDLANHYFDVGMQEEASTHFESVYENLRKVADDNDPKLINTRVRLGTLRIVKDNAKEAVEMLQKAYTALADGPNKDIPKSIDTANLLALAKLKSGNPVDAQSLFSWVSEEAVKLRNSYAPATGTWLSAEEGVANAMVAQEKFEEAEKQLEKLLVSENKFLGPNHAWTRRAKQTLAGVYKSLGKTDLQKGVLDDLNSGNPDK